ncbi:hypothetical protein Tco_0503949 [Tanacetum coccineum]
MSNVAPQQYNSQSSTNLSSTYVPPHFAHNSQLDSGLSLTDNLIANLTNTLAILTQSYKTYLPQTNNQLRTSSNPKNQATVRLVMGELLTKSGMLIQVKQGRLSAITATDLALNVDNVFQADDCNAFDSDVDEAPTAQIMFMANLSSADPIYNEVGLSYDSDILFKVHDHDHYQDVVFEHHEEHEMHDDVQLNYVVDLHADYTSNSNMISYDQYVKDNALLVSVSKTTRNIVVDNSLTAELETYKEQVELYERRARFELTEREQKIDEQLRIVITDKIAEITRRKMNDKMKDPECVTHKVKIAPPDYSKENYLATFTPQKQLTPEQIFWSQDLIKMKEEALKKQTTASRPIKALTVEENEKVKQHYKGLYDSIKITRAKHIEQTMALLTENENLKAQIHENLKCNTMESVKLRVLAPGRYAIDVEPIPPHNRNNREVHLHYLKHLKESVETLREIVEEAKVERPLDRSLASTCL